MSIQAVGWVLSNSRSRGFARLVLISLANHHNDGTGRCNPGYRLISQEAGISRSAVTAQIRKLEELEELTVITPGTSHTAAEYRLNFVQQMDEERQLRPPGEPTTSRLGPTTSTPSGQNLEPIHEPRKSRPSRDFQPTDAHREFARENGVDIGREREHWLDWCEANGRKYASVNAGFSTWLRQAVQFGRARPPGQRAGRVDFDRLSETAR